MSQAPISREYRIYLALWRKALHSSEPITIKASNRNMAIAMRQGMYRAIRPFRQGNLNDRELQDAAEKFVVYLDGKLPELTLKPRAALAELESAWEALGIDEEDLLLGDERAMEGSLKRLLEESQQPDPQRSTPFYDR